MPSGTSARRCWKRRSGGRAVESPVHRLRRKAEAAEPEFEDRDVPADRPDSELALAEKRTPTDAKGPARCSVDPAVRPELLRALERRERPSGERPGHAVDRPRVVTVGLERHLGGGYSWVGRGGVLDGAEDAHRQRNASGGDASHEGRIRARAAASSPPSRNPNLPWSRQGPPVQSGGCLPR
jgi:hypothetical protein